MVERLRQRRCGRWRGMNCLGMYFVGSRQLPMKVLAQPSRSSSAYSGCISGFIHVIAE